MQRNKKRSINVQYGEQGICDKCMGAAIIMDIRYYIEMSMFMLPLEMKNLLHSLHSYVWYGHMARWQT